MTDHLSASRINHATLLVWFFIFVIILPTPPLFAETLAAGQENADQRPASTTQETPQQAPCCIIVPDGQLISQPIRVFVPGQKITFAHNPNLCLIRIGNDWEYVPGHESQCFGGLRTPFEVAADQQWRVETDEKNPLTLNGTTLLFALGDLTVSNFRSGIRVLPVLRWRGETGGETGSVPQITRPATGNNFIAVNDRQIYLVNRIGTTVWTLGILGIMIFLLHLMTRKNPGGLLSLITSADGALSVSLTQVALWTMAVGGIVLGYGFMRLKVPNIPDSLLLLMGFSVLTASVGQWQTQRLVSPERGGLIIPADGRRQAQRQTGPTKASWSDLVMNLTPTGPQPSLAKAQMLFWTIISIILFVVKSILDGIIWDVPTQLVLLMGISQGSYLTLKQIAGTEKKQ